MIWLDDVMIGNLATKGTYQNLRDESLQPVNA